MTEENKRYEEKYGIYVVNKDGSLVSMAGISGVESYYTGILKVTEKARDLTNKYPDATFTILEVYSKKFEQD